MLVDTDRYVTDDIYISESTTVRHIRHDATSGMYRVILGILHCRVVQSFAQQFTKVGDLLGIQHNLE